MVHRETSQAVLIDESVASWGDSCTTQLVRQLSRRLIRLQDAGIAAVGVRATQFPALAYVMEMGPVTHSRLAEALGISLSTLNRTIAPLIAGGWIEQVVGRDARSRLLSLTPEGVCRYEEALRLWTAVQDQLHREMGRENVQRLYSDLACCEAAICRIVATNGHQELAEDGTG